MTIKCHFQYHKSIKNSTCLIFISQINLFELVFFSVFAEFFYLKSDCWGKRYCFVNFFIVKYIPKRPPKNSFERAFRIQAIDGDN